MFQQNLSLDHFQAFCTPPPLPWLTTCVLPVLGPQEITMGFMGNILFGHREQEAVSHNSLQGVSLWREIYNRYNHSNDVTHSCEPIQIIAVRLLLDFQSSVTRTWPYMGVGNYIQLSRCTDVTVLDKGGGEVLHQIFGSWVQHVNKNWTQSDVSFCETLYQF